MQNLLESGKPASRALVEWAACDAAYWEVAPLWGKGILSDGQMRQMVDSYREREEWRREVEREMARELDKLVPLDLEDLLSDEELEEIEALCTVWQEVGMC